MAEADPTRTSPEQRQEVLHRLVQNNRDGVGVNLDPIEVRQRIALRRRAFEEYRILTRPEIPGLPVIRATEADQDESTISLGHFTPTRAAKPITTLPLIAGTPSPISTDLPRYVVMQHKWKAHTDAVKSMELIPEAFTLTSASFDGMVHMWSIDGDCLGSLHQGRTAEDAPPLLDLVDNAQRQSNVNDDLKEDHPKEPPLPKPTGKEMPALGIHSDPTQAPKGDFVVVV